MKQGHEPELENVSMADLRDFSFLKIPVPYPEQLLNQSRAAILSKVEPLPWYLRIGWSRIGLVVLVSFYGVLGIASAIIMEVDFFLDFLLAALNSEALPFGIPLACLYLFLMGVGLRLMNQTDDDSHPESLI